ncbi:hypothetical protein ACIBLA_25410 [Streptomyces sp. NPDC050433]|uniref:hypothetical protein n=1 Tax=unclassified Streptomyces TaxID=2593676 RepID=UPI0034123D17
MVVAVFFGAALSVQAASFDNMFKTDNTDWNCHDGEPGESFHCRTDNGYLTFGIEPGMTSTGDSDVREAMRDEYGPTDLEVHEHRGSDIVYSGSSETDIIFDYNDPPLPSNVLGRTWCNDATSDYECDQHYISFDNSNSDPWKATVCHEAGHAVGLTHGEYASPDQGNGISALGCVRTPLQSGYRDLGSHNVGQINGAYAKP